MGELEQRIAGLSKEKRELLELLLAEEQDGAPGTAIPRSTPAGQSVGRAGDFLETIKQFDVDTGGLPFSSLLEANLTQANPSTDALKDLVKQIYTSISERFSPTGIGDYSIFLNYGYAPDHNPQYSPIPLPEHVLNKNNVKLVLELIGECDVTGCEVLDVGCGRGGTVSTIGHYYRTKRLVGLDLTPANVAFCQGHLGTGTGFLVGDAERLPFMPATFDVITNVESSNHYPNVFSFYAEVFRVLRPGGYLLYTDLFSAAYEQHNLRFLRDLGLVVEHDRDITSNVLLSCDETADRYLRTYAGYDAELDNEFVKNFLAAPGSQAYNELKDGRLTYRIFRLRKPWPLAGIAGPLREMAR
jgi:SAM-dependent methyltransferase